MLYKQHKLTRGINAIKLQLKVTKAITTTITGELSKVCSRLQRCLCMCVWWKKSEKSNFEEANTWQQTVTAAAKMHIIKKNIYMNGELPKFTPIHVPPTP